MFPPPTFTDEDASARRDELTDTHVAQAALGATELAYLRVLSELGVEPDMTAGHSYGEFVALAAAGGLEAEQLLMLSEARGRHMAQAAAGEAGAMAAVEASAATLAPLLDEGDVVAANLNGPNQTVISGPWQAIEQAVAWCAERDLRARVLPVSCAFHSPQVAGARTTLLGRAQTRDDLARRGSRSISNTTGKPHAADPDTIAQVLRRHIVKPVRFVDEIEAMHEAGARVFVEVGPRSVLTGLTGQILAEREHVAVAVDRSGRSSLLSLLHGLAALATEGVPVRVDRLLRGRPAKRVNLTRLTAAAAPPPPGQWLVDGGRARPASEPVSTVADSNHPSRASSTAADSNHPTPGAASRDQHLITAPGRRCPSPQPNRRPAPASQRQRQRQRPPGPAPAAGWIEPRPSRAARAGAADRRPRRRRDAPLPAGDAAVPGDRAFGDARLSRGRPSGPGRPAGSAAVITRRARPLSVSTPMQQFAAPRHLPAPAPRRRHLPRPVPPRSRGRARPGGAAPPRPPRAAPAAAPPAAEPVAAPAEPAVALTHEQIEARLLDVVSERTGYPTDMLSLDADLEGDLGIDSIKRVEIAGTFTQTLAEEQRAAIDMEQLTSSRTLREVIAVLEEGIRPTAPAPPEPISPAAGRPPRRRSPLLNHDRPRRSASAGSSCTL